MLRVVLVSYKFPVRETVLRNLKRLNFGDSQSEVPIPVPPTACVTLDKSLNPLFFKMQIYIKHILQKLLHVIYDMTAGVLSL